MQGLDPNYTVYPYRMDEVRTYHGASAALPGLAMHHRNVLRVLVQPVCHLLTKISDQRQWWGLRNVLSVLLPVLPGVSHSKRMLENMMHTRIDGVMCVACSVTTDNAR